MRKTTVRTIRNIITRDFVLGFSAQFIFSIAYHVFIPTLPVYLSRLGSTEATIGVLIGILGVSSLISRPFVGKALLRIPEKRCMAAGALLFALSSLSYLIAPPFWPFLVVRVVHGVAVAFFYTASITFIANISPEDRRGQTLTYFLLAANVSFALAPSFGIFVMNHFSFTVLFVGCFGLSLVSLVIINRMSKRPIAPSGDPTREEGSFLSRKALPPSIVSFFFHFIWGALTAFFPIYAIQHGMANPGLFFTTIAVMLISVRALGGRILDLYPVKKVIPLCLVAMTASMVILVFSRSSPLFFLVAVIWGIGHAILVPALVVYVVDRAGSARGPTMATYTAVGDLGMSMGPVTMGIVIDFTSYPSMFFCLALTGIINLVYFCFLIRERKIPAP